MYVSTAAAAADNRDQSLPHLMALIKAGVGAIGKSERNQQQGFNFRGIDAVINAVAPVLIEHCVTVVPMVTDYQYGTVEVGRQRTPMGHARVTVTYTFIGPLGDTIVCSAPGEAMDSGDKATAKAMSVAYRTALLQALSLPTTDPDPDAVVYERTDTAALDAAVARVQTAWMAANDGALDMQALSNDYYSRYGQDVRRADVAALDAYAVALGGEPMPTTQDMLSRATASQTVKDEEQEPIKVKDRPKS